MSLGQRAGLARQLCRFSCVLRLNRCFSLCRCWLPISLRTLPLSLSLSRSLSLSLSVSLSRSLSRSLSLSLSLARSLAILFPPLTPRPICTDFGRSLSIFVARLFPFEEGSFQTHLRSKGSYADFPTAQENLPHKAQQRRVLHVLNTHGHTHTDISTHVTAFGSHLHLEILSRSGLNELRQWEKRSFSLYEALLPT